MPTVELAAGPVEYVDTGGDKPVIVFLHGLLMDHTLWDEVVRSLQGQYRCVLPTLPLGSHRRPMNADADLGLRGMVHLVADFLDALDLDGVTLVHSDWGGGLFLTAEGRDARVGRLVVCPCEAFDNFPPGIPGRLAQWGARLPGGIELALRQLNKSWLRRSPLVLGRMAKRPLPDELVSGWTRAGLASAEVRRDLRKYARRTWPDAELVAATEALADFAGPALVLWAPESTVMPPRTRPAAGRPAAARPPRRGRGLLRTGLHRPAADGGAAHRRGLTRRDLRTRDRPAAFAQEPAPTADR